MGTIIGDGITFDDVLLVPQYSEVTPNMVDLSRNGHSYRTSYGDCHGKTGRYWYHS